MAGQKTEFINPVKLCQEINKYIGMGFFPYFTDFNF